MGGTTAGQDCSLEYSIHIVQGSNLPPPRGLPTVVQRFICAGCKNINRVCSEPSGSAQKRIPPIPELLPVQEGGGGLVTLH